MNKQQAAEALGVLTCLRAYRHYLDEKEHERYLSHLSTLQSVIEAGEKPLSAQGMVDDYADMIRYLLPLAKGYVHAHPGIRSTECIIEDAEAMIAARPRGE